MGLATQNLSRKVFCPELTPGHCAAEQGVLEDSLPASASSELLELTLVNHNVSFYGAIWTRCSGSNVVPCVPSKLSV